MDICPFIIHINLVGVLKIFPWLGLNCEGRPIGRRLFLATGFPSIYVMIWVTLVVVGVLIADNSLL